MKLRDWLPTICAAGAFVVFLGAFAWELFAYQHKVIEWARRDLQSRVDLAAANLEEPLRTQDFAKIHAFGEYCRSEGLRLLITGHSGGLLFDSLPPTTGEKTTFSAEARCGEYVVTIGMPQSRVFAPFWLAVIGFCLSGLVGVAGVFLFFLVTYRQRVRIRELARVEEFRRTFIADLSHEIKTPLSGILGATDLLTDNSPLVPLIKKEVARLGSLVQRLLDLSRLEREGEQLKLTETDLYDLARETVARYVAKGVHLNETSHAIMCRCDAMLIEQALANLIENALRHSGTTEIAVTVGERAQGVFLMVEDHGVGIPPEHLARIFDRFYRVDPARAAETGGAGLGLAIVRRIVRLHGGEAICENVLPQGARFILNLPRRG